VPCTKKCNRILEWTRHLLHLLFQTIVYRDHILYMFWCVLSRIVNQDTCGHNPVNRYMGCCTLVCHTFWSTFVPCNQGRLHVPCTKKCNRILVCGHICTDYCNYSCGPCKSRCQRRCRFATCVSTLITMRTSPLTSWFTWSTGIVTIVCAYVSTY
jgi:hypothetical protein